MVVNPVDNPADDSHAYYALSQGAVRGRQLRRADSATRATGRRARRCSTPPPSTRPAAPAKGRRGSSRRCWARRDPRRLRLPGLGAPAVAGAYGRWAGLLAAVAVAVYPPFIHSTGELMSEPPAILTLPAAVLAFLWAGEQERPWAWLAPRPALRPDGDVPPRVPVRRRRLRRPRRDPGQARDGAGWRPALAGGGRAAGRAAGLPIVPWTIRNLVVLDRLVPISTGSGKALYVGTYLPADGEYQRVKAILYERYEGRTCAPNSEALDEVDPTPLFDRVADDRYPRTRPRDAALGKIGKENFSTYFGEDPLGYLAMTARKVGRMWSSGVGEAMSSTPGRVVQILLVFARPGRLRPARPAPALVGAGRAGDPDRARHRGRRGLAGGAAPQRGADDAGLSACRPGPVRGGRGPILWPRMALPPSRHLPRRTDGAAQRRADLRGRC